MRTELTWQIGPEPPEWLRLLPLGEVKLGDGREPFRVTPASLAGIVEAWRRRGNEMVIDYEHQTVSGREAPAAGWVKEMAIRPDGLWARVEWTPRAKEYLARKEYRYFSPVVELDDNREVRDLLHVALTNVPAIANLPPLVLKSREDGQDQVELEKFGGGQQQSWEMLKERLVAELQAAAGAEAEPEKLWAQWCAWRAAAAEAEELRAEVARLRQRQRQEQARQLIQEALQTGRTTPAELAAGGGRLKRLAEEEPEFFRELILTRPPRCAIPGPLGWQEPRQEWRLSAAELEICRQLQLKPEDFWSLKKLLTEKEQSTTAVTEE